MNKQELLERLKYIYDGGLQRDEEVCHLEADRALLAYINDTEITLAFDKIEKWYA